MKYRSFYKEHGGTGSSEYRTWIAMRQRCLNPKDKRYRHYGGRGITICKRWREDFAAFLADMGPRPKGATLDRRDNDGPYSPENCRWATYAEQNRNNRNNRKVTFKGRTMCVQDWAKELGLTHPGLVYRLDTWPLEKALTARPSR